MPARSESEGAGDALFASALKILTRRDVSAQELTERLARKGASSDEIQAVVTEMRRRGYINDRELAAEHIRRGRERRLVGRLLLTLELRRKGVVEDYIRDALDDLYLVEAEAEVAQAFIAKHYPRLDQTNPKELRRVLAALERRGLGGEGILSILEGLSDDKPGKDDGY